MTDPEYGLLEHLKPLCAECRDWEAGAQHERISIVAWLRRYALQRDSDWASDSYATFIAGAIERGEHDD